MFTEGGEDIFLDRAKRELSVMQMNHCGIQECEKGHMWQFQARPYHLLHFVLHGEGSLKISGRMLNVHAGQAFFIPAGMKGKYIASLQNPWKYAWIGFYADNGNKFIDLLFGKNEILDLALPAKELEKEILSILSVMDKRLQDVAIYQEEDFPGEQFFSIRNFSASLEANSRMLHLFARLLETQGDIKTIWTACTAGISGSRMWQESSMYIQTISAHCSAGNTTSHHGNVFVK